MTPFKTQKQVQSDYRQQGWWLGERLDHRYHHHVSSNPAGLAVADSGGIELTHKDLWTRADALAQAMSKRGVARGDVLMLFMPNRVEWQLALLATLRLQAIPASIPARTDAATLAYCAKLTGCKTLITCDDKNGAGLFETAVAASREIDNALPVLRISLAGIRDCMNVDTCIEEQDQMPQGLDHIMFTSSTTGLPKAVMHTVDTLAALNLHFSERFSLDAHTPILMPSPLGHSVGGIHGARLALFTGAPLVLQESWQPGEAIRLAMDYNSRFCVAATPFLKDLVDARRANGIEGASLGTFLCGGAPVPPSLLEEAWDAFPKTFFTNLWGMTEGGLVTCLPESPRKKLTNTAGVALPGLELRILAEDSTDCTAGKEGELAMRGPGVFVGYAGQRDLYESLLDNDGFFRTGDLARIDADGYVQITGRLKDLIIRGGVNISPIPTEDVLAAHPKLKAVAVVGFPDERLGERLCAVVEPDVEKPTLDELIKFAKERGLSTKQLPEVCRYIRSMPRTAAGKIRKPVLHKLIQKSGLNNVDLEPGDAC